MGKIIVTGASGQFGMAAARGLLDHVPASDLILLSRSPAKLADFAQQGASVREADFESPDSLAEAMAGGEKMLLISTTMVGERPRQHGNAIDAAVAAGVRHIVYTSVTDGGNPDHPAVEQHDHYATEQMLKDSGVAYTILRNSQYAEAVAMAMVGPALASGSKADNCGSGRIAFVSRDDCVAAAIAALTGGGHENRVYDITGPELLSVPEALALASEMAGKNIDLIPVDDEGMYEYFDSIGAVRKPADLTPETPIPWASEGMVTFGQAIREGHFDVKSDAVEQLTGRKPRSLRSVYEQYRETWPA